MSKLQLGLGTLSLVAAVVLLGVMLSSGPGFSASLPKEHAVWFYWSKNYSLLHPSTVDNFAGKGIDTIYFSTVRADQPYDAALQQNITTFIRYARSQGLNVFGVIMQDPLPALKNTSDLQTTFQRIIDQQDGLFDGYIIDVEPHVTSRIYPQYPNFSQDLNTTKWYLDHFIQMDHALAQTAHANNVLYAATIPYWYHTRFRDVGYEEGHDVLDADFLVLMTYVRDSGSVLARVGDAVLNSSAQIVIGVNIAPGSVDPYMPEAEVGRWLTTLTAYRQDHPEVLGTAFFDSRTLLAHNATSYVEE